MFDLCLSIIKVVCLQNIYFFIFRPVMDMMDIEVMDIAIGIHGTVETRPVNEVRDNHYIKLCIKYCL